MIMISQRHSLFSCLVPPNATVTSSLSSPLREGRDSVTLTCSADSNPPPTYIWVRSNGLGEVGRGPTLGISPVTRADIDTYTCIASNSLGSSKPQSVDIDIYFVPNVTIIPSAPAPGALIEGRDSLILDCNVDANPEPSISWYKDVQTDGSGVPRLQVFLGDREMHSSSYINFVFQEISRGSNLRLDTVNRHDAGLYSCVATNIIGESERADIPIDVHYLLTVILEPDVGSLEDRGEEGTVLDVDCLVTDSAPVSRVTWIKVGETSVYSTGTRISVGTNNTGEFLCTAVNSVGPSLTASLMVNIKGKEDKHEDLTTSYHFYF